MFNIEQNSKPLFRYDVIVDVTRAWVKLALILAHFQEPVYAFMNGVKCFNNEVILKRFCFGVILIFVKFVVVSNVLYGQ